MSNVTGSEAAQKGLRRRDEQKARQAREDVAWLLSEPQGRRVMWRLLGSAGLFSETFTGEPHGTIHAEGRRSVAVGLMVAAQEAAPESYALMIAEQMRALEDDKTHKRHAESQAAEPEQ